MVSMCGLGRGLEYYSNCVIPRIHLLSYVCDRLFTTVTLGPCRCHAQLMSQLVLGNFVGCQICNRW